MSGDSTLKEVETSKQNFGMSVNEGVASGSEPCAEIARVKCPNVRRNANFS